MFASFIKIHKQSQISTKKQHFEDTNEELNYNDYLMDLPSTIREKEERAPKLSLSFLRKNINAQQRHIIVSHLIHLGVRLT